MVATSAVLSDRFGAGPAVASQVECGMTDAFSPRPSVHPSPNYVLVRPSIHPCNMPYELAGDSCYSEG